jgi:hypothetical protein
MPDVVEADDLSIPDTDRLFRRVPPNQLEPLEDGSLRPSSAVFKHARMSVNIECLMVEQGRPPEDTLTGNPGHYLTSIIAGDVRAKGYPIVKDTDPPNDPAHGLVLGKKTSSFAKVMLASHHWIVLPPPRQQD